MNIKFLKTEERDLDVYRIWHDRFVTEYDRSEQYRVGVPLDRYIPKELWLENRSSNFFANWIKDGNRIIGFVNTSEGWTADKLTGATEPLRLVQDVYVDRRYRGRGILSKALEHYSDLGYNGIVIDRHKLAENCIYYHTRGYHWMTVWKEQNLLILSKQEIKYVPCRNLNALEGVV